MSKTIDEKVVSLEFDNKKFGDNVSDSITWLDRLKEKLQFKGAEKGFDEIQKSSDKINFSNMTDGLDSVSVKFSALETVAFSVLNRITQKAVDTGLELTKSLSVDQISAGWGKYDEQTTAVQTLVNSTGKSVEEIYKYLEKLQWYSDETSYSFTDMVSALASMTTVGGNIDELIPMITGIANATAFAGKSSAEFSRAIFNIGQSYSMGYMTSIDWKSVQQAGVGSKQLQQAFIESAISTGSLYKTIDTDIKTAQETIESYKEAIERTSDKDEIKEYTKELEEYEESLDKLLEKRYELEDNFREYASSNFLGSLQSKDSPAPYWLTQEVMEDAFARFSKLSDAAYEAVNAGEYDTASEAIDALADSFDELSVRAFKSAQEAKTFNEAILATKDAVSSGWMKVFTKIFGEYDEARDLWTEFANRLWDTFASGFDGVLDILDKWRELGGRNELLDSFRNLYDVIESIGSIIKISFERIFPPKTGEDLYNLTVKFKEFTESLKLSQEQIVILKNTFASIFGIFKGITNTIKSIVKPIKNAFSEIFGDNYFGSYIKNIVGSIKDFINGLELSEESSDNFKNMFKGIFSVIKLVLDIFERLISELPKIAPLISKIVGFISSILGPIGKWLSDTIENGDIVNKIHNIIIGIIDWISNLGEKIGPFFSNLWTSISDFVKKAKDFLSPVFSNIGSWFSSLGEKIGPFFSNLWTSISDFVKKAKDFLSPVFSNIGSWFSNLFGGSNKVDDGVAKNIEEVSDVIEVNSASLPKYADNISESINEITDSINENSNVEIKETIFDKIGKAFSNAYEWLKTTIFPAISDIWEKIKNFFANINPDDIKSIVEKLISIIWLIIDMKLVNGIADFISGLGKITKNTGKLIASTTGVIDSVKNLIDSFSGIGRAITTGIQNTFKSIQQYITAKKLQVYVEMFKIMATSILIIAGAIALLSGLDTGKMIAATITLGVFTVLIWEIYKHLTDIPAVDNDSIKKLKSTGKNFLSISISILVIAFAINKIGKMLINILKVVNTDNLGEFAAVSGLLAGIMATIFAGLLLTSKFGNPDKAIMIAASFAVIAGSLNLIAMAISQLAYYNWNAILPGLISLGGALALISGILVGLSFLKGDILSAAGAIAIVSASLLLISFALSESMSLDWEKKWGGALALAGILAIIIGGLILLSKVSEEALIGAAAILAVGVTMVAVSSSFFIFAEAINVIEKTLESFVLLVANNSEDLIKALNIIIEYIPKFILAIGKGIKDIILMSLSLMPTIAAGIISGIDDFLKELVKKIPSIADSIIKIIFAILAKIEENVVELVSYIVRINLAIIAGVIRGIAKELPNIMSAFGELIISFMKGLADLFDVSTPDSPGSRFLDAVDKLCANLWNFILEALNRLWKKLNEWLGPVFNDIGKWFSDLWESIKNWWSGPDGIWTKISNFFKGIGETVKGWVETGWNTVYGFFTDLPKKIIQIGSDIINGLKKGIEDAWENVTKTVGDVANSIWTGVCNFFGIHSPSTKMAEIGEYIDLGLAQGILGGSGDITKATDTVGNSIMDSISKVVDGIDSDMDLAPTITPVVDLTNVEKAGDSMNGLFGNVDLGSITSNFGGSTQLASLASGSMKAFESQNQNNPLNKFTNMSSGGYSISNTFNITGNDPDAIADRVATILQEQVERREAVWA